MSCTTVWRGREEVQLTDSVALHVATTQECQVGINGQLRALRITSISTQLYLFCELFQFDLKSSFQFIRFAFLRRRNETEAVMKYHRLSWPRCEMAKRTHSRSTEAASSICKWIAVIFRSFSLRVISSVMTNLRATTATRVQTVVTTLR